VAIDYTISNTPVYLQAGQYYPITVEYQQLPLYSMVFLFWQTDGVPMSLVPDSAYYVTTADFNSYSTLQYYNHVAGEGSGFKNDFYTSDGSGGKTLVYSENNNIDYAWIFGAPEGITDDVFYGEMNGWLEARYSEKLKLKFLVDDGIRVWVGDEEGQWYNEGEPVIDEWNKNPVSLFEYSFDTVAGHKYRIRIEYTDMGLGATCVMHWKSDALPEVAVPAKFMYTE
jgi:hypothetical protein